MRFESDKGHTGACKTSPKRLVRGSERIAETT